MKENNKENVNENNKEQKNDFPFKKVDFVEINFVAKVDDKVFDTNILEVAKKENLQGKGIFKPLIVPLEEGFLLQGLYEFLKDKNPGKYTVEIPPEKAFGKKNAKLLQTLNLNVFKKQNLNPYPGMEVQINDSVGIVKNVGSGRVLVDFNHPLAGKTVVYEVDYLRKVEDPVRNLNALVNLVLKLPENLYSITKNDDVLKLKINLKEEEFPKEALNDFVKMAEAMIKGVKKVEFEYKKDTEKENKEVKKEDKKDEKVEEKKEDKVESKEKEGKE